MESHKISWSTPCKLKDDAAGCPYLLEGLVAKIDISLKPSDFYVQHTDAMVD